MTDHGPPASELLAPLRVAPGSPAGLAERDARDKLGLPGKSEGHDRRATVLDRLADLQRRLWAERERSVLVVLQGMDAAGKDSTIRRVFGRLNPQGVRVTNFSVPAGREAEQDYLWRVHQALPARGKIGVFNRSHYEDVTVVRAAGLQPEEVWRRRFRHIREFERMITDEGTVIVKVFLHISRDEQAHKLQRRIDDPERRWKFDVSDIEARGRWDVYAEAWEEALTETSTDHAPWDVVPADRKWVRDVAVAELVRAALERVDPQYPPADPDVDFSAVEIA